MPNKRLTLDACLHLAAELIVYAISYPSQDAELSTTNGLIINYALSTSLLNFACKCHMKWMMMVFI